MGKGCQGMCIKDPWTKPKGVGSRAGGGDGWGGGCAVGRKLRQLYLNNNEKKYLLKKKLAYKKQVKCIRKRNILVILNDQIYFFLINDGIANINYKGQHNITCILNLSQHLTVLLTLQIFRSNSIIEFKVPEVQNISI